MNKDNSSLLISIHSASVNANNFLKNVSKLKLLLEEYLSDDSESPGMKLTLKAQLDKVLLYHQKIRNRPTKLTKDEIEAEGLLKEMIGRGTSMRKQGFLANFLAPLVKIFGVKQKTHKDQIFDQLLANAKFTIPVINRANIAKEEHKTHKAPIAEKATNQRNEVSL